MVYWHNIQIFNVMI